jgi:hypothetical protein
LLLGYGALIALVLVLPSDSRLLAVLSVTLGLPLMLAVGGAIDEAHRTMPQADAGRARSLTDGFVRALLVAIYLTGSALGGWAAVRQAQNSDLAAAVAMLGLAGALGYRAWATSRRRQQRTDGPAPPTLGEASRIK